VAVEVGSPSVSESQDADEQEAPAVGTRNAACCWLADFGYSSQTNELIITHSQSRGRKE